LIIKDQKYRLSRNFDNYHCKLRNFSEECRSHLHRGASLKARIAADK